MGSDRHRHRPDHERPRRVDRTPPRRRLVRRSAPRTVLVRHRRPVRADRHAVGRRASPAPAAPDPGSRGRTCCCSTSRRTTSTSNRCAHSRTSSTSGRAPLVVVSHDRAFLERTVADVIVIDDEHDATRVPGGYAAWEAARRSALTTRRPSGAAPTSGGGSRNVADGARRLDAQPEHPALPDEGGEKSMRAAREAARRARRRACRHQPARSPPDGRARQRPRVPRGAPRRGGGQWLELASEAKG